MFTGSLLKTANSDTRHNKFRQGDTTVRVSVKKSLLNKKHTRHVRQVDEIDPCDFSSNVTTHYTKLPSHIG